MCAVLCSLGTKATGRGHVTWEVFEICIFGGGIIMGCILREVIVLISFDLSYTSLNSVISWNGNKICHGLHVYLVSLLVPQWFELLESMQLTY